MSELLNHLLYSSPHETLSGINSNMININNNYITVREMRLC